MFYNVANTCHLNAFKFETLVEEVVENDLKVRALASMERGGIAINKGVISDPAAPFGGVKQSVLGREGGFDGIHEFLETRYIGFEL